MKYKRLFADLTAFIVLRLILDTVLVPPQNGVQQFTWVACGNTWRHSHTSQGRIMSIIASLESVKRAPECHRHLRSNARVLLFVSFLGISVWRVWSKKQTF
ncbi:hypothetical protein L596_027505 [Steinernema carpocapsae]|uniref:G-protein coupled receptors family 1 profile domain-containing protein n=1 Tax=Steinernema carpocapsae TaxID=34508 RepID=A0A4U5LVQ1_STECR|nr:hypothetical protein L596_027505 [Steinernema carpocapsae]